MIRVAITGNFGTGKTTVAKVFNICFKTPVFYADEVAKRILKTNEKIKKIVTNNFGNEVYTINNELNTTYLAKKIFNNKELLNVINSIIHPLVLEEFNNFISQNKIVKNKYILFESAIIFENNLQDKFDKIILVISPDDEKLKRIVEKGYTEKDFYARLKNQINDELKKEKCDFIIYNNNTISIIEQVIKIHKILNSKNLKM